MVGAKADGIAEVVDGQAGHYGVQVDDAHALAALAVHEHVVELGVVMGHTQGQLAVPQSLESHGAISLPGGDKVQLRLHVLHPAHGVGGHGSLQLGQAVLGVVEAGNGLRVSAG